MKNKSFNTYTQRLDNPFFLPEQLLDALPLLIFVTDKSDRIIYINNKFGTLINYSASNEESMKELISMLDWNAWNENLFKLSNIADNKSCTFNIRFKVENNFKYVQLEGKVFKRDVQGKPLLYFFIANDIPQEFENQDVSDESENASSTLNKNVEEFAYVAGHDLQEPLRKITAFSSRLEHKFNTQLGDEGKLYIEKINTAANGMKQLINNLLQISRTDEYNKPFTETDLNAILKQAEQELDLKIEETHVTITHETLPVVEAYPSMMTQLFSNLLSNAIKFSSKNQLAVINIFSKEISDNEKQYLHLPAHKSYYKITFKDNGIGFNPESAEEIFKIFYRLNSKAEYPGTGIGLAICSKIIEKHNGLIWAESEPGKGAAFNVLLPKTQG